MALITFVLQDSADGHVDLTIHSEPAVPLTPVDLPGDTPAVLIGRRLVHVAKLAASKHTNHTPQEG